MKRLFILSFILSLLASASQGAVRYKGDLNGDNRVDLADMVHLAKAIKNGSTDQSLDLNASGNVDDYDLQRLADIIISGKLTEESGMNVGIGGWDDSGEDYGGTVKAPALLSRSADETRFYMRNPKGDGSGIVSMEFGVSEGTDAPCGILFNIRLPRELKFETSEIIRLEESLEATHKLYGTPKFKKENDDEWSDRYLRFIIFSPDFKQIPTITGLLGHIYYSVGDTWSDPVFKACQVVTSDSNDCTYLPDHSGGYYGNFKPIEVSYVWFDQTEISITRGDEIQLNLNIEPWEASDMSVIWTSSDEAVATVDAEGNITAVGAGTATITATCGSVSATCEITVGNDKIMGDADGNGVVDANDVVVMINYYLGVIDSIDFEVSDLNGDGVIDAQDALATSNIYLETTIK